MEKKRCRVCERLLPRSSFNRQSKSRDGLHTYCRECQRSYKARWDAENKEHVLEQARRWRRENPERRKAYMTQYRIDNAERIAETAKAWQRANQEKARAANRAWRTANKERANQASRDWNAANLRRRSEVQNARRARQMAAPSRLIAHSRKLDTDSEGTCYWCGTRAGEFHQDHVMPLAKGGPHCEENIVWACAPCNLSKSDRHPLRWIAELVS